MGIQPIRRDSTWAPNPQQMSPKKVDSEEQKAARFKEIYAQLSGSNAEQSFHLDNEIEQFGNIDLNHPMLDNQNFILDDDESTLITSAPTIETASHDSGALNALDIEADDYILYLDGNPLCAGTKEEIEKITSDLVFGISKELVLDAVEVERLSVFKKMNIKMGLFLG